MRKPQLGKCGRCGCAVLREELPKLAFSLEIVIVMIEGHEWMWSVAENQWKLRSVRCVSHQRSALGRGAWCSYDRRLTESRPPKRTTV